MIETTRTANQLLQQALINDLYARKCEETFLTTGRYSALHQAKRHVLAAQAKRDRALRMILPAEDFEPLNGLED